MHNQIASLYTFQRRYRPRPASRTVEVLPAERSVRTSSGEQVEVLPAERTRDLVDGLPRLGALVRDGVLKKRK